jgi:serine/threonine protein kinase
MSNFPDFSELGYQVIRELGHNYIGGRITYLATNTRIQQPVVVKQFQFAKFNSDWSGFKAYEREIQVLQGLSHPGIPRYLDSFETPDGFCMVQEYKNAQSLAVPRSFDPDEIKQIAVSLLEILVYLQNRIPSVIHRDIKPENILVDEQLNVYLVDFGFARIGGGEVAMSSVALGTLGFMPPEQLYNRQLT